jgi:hypothetical protein
MYTPTVLDRRPRPPGSVPHRTINLYNHTGSDSSGSSKSDTPIQKRGHARRHDSSDDTMEEDELSTEVGVSKLVEIPKGVIGLGLPHTISTTLPTSTILKSSASESNVQPSPPPPYGPSGLLGDRVASVSTPPTQDVEADPLEHTSETSHDHEEEDEDSLRRRRASEAARSLGFALEFSPTTDGSMEDGMDMDEIKNQLKQMRRRLKDRDHGELNVSSWADGSELVMAAQAADYVLRQHEELVSALPDHVRALLPQLTGFSTPRQPLVDAGSEDDDRDRVVDREHMASPGPSRIPDTGTSTAGSSTSPSRHSSKRLFRTVRNDDVSQPFPRHHHKHVRNIFNTPSTPRSRPTTAYAEVVQQEADERLIRLEMALSESRENEDQQRKLASRLRRDFDKLQRDFDHAEQSMTMAEQERPPLRSTESTSSAQSMTSSQFDSWAWKQDIRDVGDGDERVLRPRSTKLKLRIKPKNRVSSQSTQGDQEDSPVWGLTRFPEFPGEAGPSNLGDRLTRLPPRPTFNRLKAQLRHTSREKASPRQSPIRHHRVSSETVSEEDMTASPRRTSPSDRSSAKLRGRHARPGITEGTFVKERSKSKSASRDIRYRNSASRRHETSSRQQTPLRAPASAHTRYDSITSHLASVRKYVTDSVRSVTFAGSRSLGSELGSEYGDHDHERTITSDSRDQGSWQDEDPKSGSDGTDSGPYGSPIAIPANASSGLTSLAIALSSSPSTSKQKSTPFKGKAIDTPTKKSSTSRTREGSPARSPVDEFDPGSYRPKKGRRNWIRPLQLSISHGLVPAPTRQRPMLYPRTSSDGTLALAHRRLAQSGKDKTVEVSEKEELHNLVQTIVDDLTKEGRGERQLELSSPPARLVNDIIILLSVLLEWIEMFIVIIWRVSIAVRYGRESIL